MQFQGGAIDGDEDRAARRRLSEIDKRLEELRGGVVVDREQAQEEERLLTNERAGCASKLGRELGVAVVPKSGTVTLGPGVHVEAPDAFTFLRGHMLFQPEPADEGFWEVTAS